MGVLVNPYVHAAAPAFFGEISMLREFWAEDPAWTPPADGVDINTVGDLVDNGTLGVNFVTESAGVVYRSSGIGGRPALDWQNNDVRVQAATGSSGTDFSVAVVFQLATASQAGQLTDGYLAYGGYIGITVADGYYLYHPGGLTVTSATTDTNAHIAIARFKQHEGKLYIDGTSVGTPDTNGTVAAYTGMTLGQLQDDAVGGGLDGKIAYVAQYTGDLTADAGYADWLAAIKTHYGIA